MQPWRHAKSSARRFGGAWQDYLDIHEFVDFAKTACVDLRHRIVLHNTDLGVALAERAFPGRAHCAEIVLRHIEEDVGRAPALDEWMRTADRPPLSPRPPALAVLARAAAETIGLDDTAPVDEVLNVLCLPARLCSTSPSARFLLMNSFGPPLVRRLLGPARAVERSDGSEVVFDPSWVAEGMIFAHFGRIPSLGEMLAPFSGHLQ